MGDFGGRLPGPAHVPEGTAADQVLLPISSFCSAGQIGNQSTKRFLCQLITLKLLARLLLSLLSKREQADPDNSSSKQLRRKVHLSVEGRLGRNKHAILLDTGQRRNDNLLKEKGVLPLTRPHHVGPAPVPTRFPAQKGGHPSMRSLFSKLCYQVRLPYPISHIISS